MGNPNKPKPGFSDRPGKTTTLVTTILEIREYELRFLLCIKVFGITSDSTTSDEVRLSAVAFFTI